MPKRTAAPVGDAMTLDAYTHHAEPPDPVATIGVWQVWQADAITIRRRDNNQAMLFQHIIEWLAGNPDAEITAVAPGRWDCGRQVTLFVWRRKEPAPDGQA